MDAIASPAPDARTTMASFDAIIMGAGVSGLYQLYKLRELGLRTLVLEDGSNVGGTWYWNRYPGPHAGLGNFPRTAEYSVEWLTGLIRFAHERGLTRIEATAEGTVEWTEHVIAMGQGLLANEVDSRMTGINRNLEGKQRRKIMRSSGGYPAYREHCDAVAADNYRARSLA